MIDDETRRELNALKQGASFATGSFDLNVSSTATIVAKRGVSATSIISLMPAVTSTSSASNYTDIQWIVPAKDQFTVKHTSSTSARTYRFSFLTPTG